MGAPHLPASCPYICIGVAPQQYSSTPSASTFPDALQQRFISYGSVHCLSCLIFDRDRHRTSIIQLKPQPQHASTSLWNRIPQSCILWDLTGGDTSRVTGLTKPPSMHRQIAANPANLEGSASRCKICHFEGWKQGGKASTLEILYLHGTSAYM